MAIGQRFCGDCGAALGDDLSGSPGGERRGPQRVTERKLATILFADVVGFTSLAERTDPELVARMVDAAFRDLGKVVVEHGGTIDKYMGDSVMAVFGVPVAHDDDAERAVAAALAIRQLEGDLVFSVGINSGEVMATPVGSGDTTVIGDTVNVAARLEKAAAPGEVLCGRLTAELAGKRVRFRERQPVPLKGKSAPVQVWEALSLGNREASQTFDDVPLIGRRTELDFLAAQWGRCRDEHQTHLVVLCGEAGSGKTRLLSELVRLVDSEALVVRSSYPGYGAMGGRKLAADVLAQFGPTGEVEVDTRVRSMAGYVDASLKAMDPGAIGQEQLWAFARLLKDKAKDRPVLVIVDDMHRSDERTLDLLSELSRTLSGVRLLTVLAGRTEPAEWLSNFSSATTLRLLPLSDADAACVAGDLMGEKPLAPDASEFVVGLSGGNPLYLRELISMARSEGLLVEDGQSYRLKEHSSIPPTLQALLAAKLDALDPLQKQLIQHAAVLGDVTADKISLLGTPNASQLLEPLVASGFFKRDLSGQYRMEDSLLREVAYEMLPRNTRGDLHRRAAEVVDNPEERARHLERAARYLADDQALASEAAEALVDAGEAFLQASSHLDAIRLFERAVALGANRPSLLIELAQLQSLCGRMEAALDTLRLVEDDPEDPAVAVERDHTAGTARMFRDPASAVVALEDAARRWSALGNTTKEAWAHANAGVAWFNQSQVEASAEHLELALELFESVEDRAGAVSASSFLCIAEPADPRVPQWLDEVLAFADASGDRSKRINALATLSWRNFLRSLTGSWQDMEEAFSAAEQLGQVSEEVGANDMALTARSLQAIMARQCGRLEDARQYVTIVQRLGAVAGHYGSWLAWAASFCVTVASGAPEAAPPFPPETEADPVALLSALIMTAELALSGRMDESLEHFLTGRFTEFRGPLSDVSVVLYAVVLVLAGRLAEAEDWIDRARRGADALGALAPRLSGDAMKAEVTGDVSGLPTQRSAGASLSEALILRALVRAGDVEALGSLRTLASELAMPGLLLGVYTA
jgi:class 3 adenylate cyclase/tetratricopeptide (TPR) repeat protein